jgi:1,4-dihydroxy-2-naphthoate octaprenyltransferase
MGKLLNMARPKFLFAGLLLFILEAAWAILLGAHFSLARLLLGYLVLLPAHLSVSYSNDYFDVAADQHGKPSFFSGGTGILVNHPELRNPAKWIAIALILCSVALGLCFQILYSAPIWFIGLVILGNLSGWFYSAPPLRLAYRGLGELVMIFIIGLLFPVFGYVVTSGHIDLDGMVLSIPLVLYGLAFILSVENPDMEADRMGNKRTWVVRRGRSFGFSLTGAALGLPSGFPCPGYPVTAAPGSRDRRMDQAAFGEGAGCPGCVLDPELLRGLLPPGRCIPGYPGLKIAGGP